MQWGTVLDSIPDLSRSGSQRQQHIIQAGSPCRLHWHWHFARKRVADTGPLDMRHSYLHSPLA